MLVSTGCTGPMSSRKDARWQKTVQGRQPYHGMNELVASNHSKRSFSCGAARARTNTDISEVDIIDVLSVASRAEVKQWYEENDEDIQNGLFWRQAFDVRTYELSVCS